MKEVYSKPISEIERFKAADIMTEATSEGYGTVLGYYADDSNSNYFAD